MVVPYQPAHPFCMHTPSLAQAACTSITHLASLASPAQEPLPALVLKPLVVALVADLAHQHSRVRLAALHALSALVQRGMPLALMQEGILPALRPLAQDHVPAVRGALFGCVARWAGSDLPPDGAGDDDGRAANQCRSFLPLLLPLILLGLTDEVEATRSATHSQLEAISARLASQASCLGLSRRCRWPFSGCLVRVPIRSYMGLLVCRPPFLHPCSAASRRS